MTLAACFAGEFVQGLPCTDDSECGPRLQCEDGLCGGFGPQASCGNQLVEVGESCDDGNSEDNDGCTSTCLLSAPEFVLVHTKSFYLQWEQVRDAEWYELYERADLGEDFVQLGGKIDTHSYPFALTVPLPFRVNASYKFLACHSKGNSETCVESAEVEASGYLDSAIGYFSSYNYDTGVGDDFGRSIALSGDGSILAVGAPGDDGNATGVNNEDSGIAADSGAVYVRKHLEFNYWEEDYIKSPDTNAEDRFGSSVALSEDGNILAVGAPFKNTLVEDGVMVETGAVYIFSQAGSTWEHNSVTTTNTGTGVIPPTNFGTTVALSGDGNTLAVRANVEGPIVYIFTKEKNTWELQHFVEGTDINDFFGDSIALSEDGNTLAVGAPGEDSKAGGINGSEANNLLKESGAVYVYTREGEIWTRHAYVKASYPRMYDSFGTSVALSNDGNILAIGAPGDLNFDTNSSAPGTVYLFAREGDDWKQQYLQASNADAGDSFGASVTLSGDGDSLVVGATGERSNSIGINGDQGDNSLVLAGAAYFFSRTGKTWKQFAYLKSSHTAGDDFFGSSVSISADASTLAIGAPEVNEGLAFDSGAVFLY